jgi:putative ABC transport system permease protein
METPPLPPRLILRFFRWYCHPRLVNHIEGDLIEVYRHRVRKTGKRKADLRFLVDVLLLFRKGIIKPINKHQYINSRGMYQTYFKVGWRSLLKSKGYSFVNIFGLALAIACGFVIVLFIHDELKYDRYHSKAERIYRVTRDFRSEGVVNLNLAQVAPPIGPLLKNDFREIEEQARTRRYNFLVSFPDKSKESSYQNDVFFAEPQLLDIFDIALKEGNPKNALNNPFTLMLSRKTAEKYFGAERASGKMIVDLNDNKTYEVSGVFEDFPSESHWHPEVLVAFSTLQDSTIYGRRHLETNWGNNAFNTYLLTTADFNAKTLEPQLPKFIDKYMGPFEAGSGVLPSTWTTLHVQKVTDIHLHSQLDSEIEANGNITTIYMIGVIGIFIILIAAFNFINLSTARAVRRAKEAGLRKVVGAYRSQLVFQYLCESMLTTIFAFFIALAISPFILLWANDFTGKQLDLTAFLSNPLVAVIAFGFALLIGLLSGIYPAFVISAFKPSTILKGDTGTQSKGVLRKILVVAQFSISLVIGIATLVVYRQLHFMNNRELGYNKDQVVGTDIPNSLRENYDAFQNELLKNSGIKNVARSSYIPASFVSSANGAKVEKGDSLANVDFAIRNVRTDFDFFDTYEIKLAAGRFFSRDIKTDDSIAYILNESAVRKLGWSNEEAIDKAFQYGDIKGKIIGVVKDFHMESLYEEIGPLVFFPGRYYGIMSIKISGDIQEGIAHIEKVWKEFVPERPFVFDFLDVRYQRLYNREEKQGKLFAFFSGLAIFIACLGLFGLTTFSTLQRVKEIGIRKVLGASVQNIVRMLVKEMLGLILVSNIIAWPLAWYLMNQWLEKFAYRIGNELWIYICAGLAMVTIALITMSFQSVRAALTNPVNSLKHE